MDFSLCIAYMWHGYLYNRSIMRTEKDKQKLVDEQLEKEFRILEHLEKIQEINKKNKIERKHVIIQKER